MAAQPPTAASTLSGVSSARSLAARGLEPAAAAGAGVRAAALLASQAVLPLTLPPAGCAALVQGEVTEVVGPRPGVHASTAPAAAAASDATADEDAAASAGAARAPTENHCPILPPTGTAFFKAAVFALAAPAVLMGVAEACDGQVATQSVAVTGG
jgi:hypothetical protein